MRCFERQVDFFLSQRHLSVELLILQDRPLDEPLPFFWAQLLHVAIFDLDACDEITLFDAEVF